MTYFVTQRNGIRAVTDRLPDTGVEESFRRMEDAFQAMQRKDARDSRKAIAVTTALWAMLLIGCGYLIGSLPAAEPRQTRSMERIEYWEPPYSPPKEHVPVKFVEPCREHILHGCLD